MTMKLSGKEIQDKFCEININALWVRGRGMIFMTACYGTDCAVSGHYKLYSRETSADILKQIISARSDGDTDSIEFWLHDREIPGRYYDVR